MRRMEKFTIATSVMVLVAFGLQDAANAACARQLTPITHEILGSCCTTQNRCSTDINNSIAALSASSDRGGTLFLAGSLELDKPITLRSNVTIEGRGSARLVPRHSSSRRGFTLLSFFEKLSNAPLENVLIRGIDADGKQRTQNFIHFVEDLPGGSIDLINLRVEKNSIRNLTGRGILIHSDPGAGRLRLRNLSIIDNTIVDLADTGIDITGHLGSRAENGPIFVQGNTLKNVGMNSAEEKIGFGIMIGEATDIFIDRNSVENTCEDAIRVNNSNQTLISGNAVRGSREVPNVNCLDVAGIKAYGSDNVTIVGNSVHGTSRHGVEVIFSTNISVSGNSIEAIGASSRPDFGNGVTVWNRLEENKRVENVAVVGNSIRDVMQGIVVDAGDNETTFIEDVIISGNTVTHTCIAVALSRNAGRGLYHVNVTGNTLRADGVITDPNRCTPDERYSILTDKVYYLTAMGNQLTGIRRIVGSR